MYNLIIIGGGPAGVTAGIYASRKKLKTLLLTFDFIGQTGKAFTVENYPGFKEIKGLDLAQRLKNQIENHEIEIKEGEKVREVRKEKDVFYIKTGDSEYQAKAVIVATGRDPRPLEVPGEKEFLGRGISYCVTCDGPLFQDKIVAVIGGGNSGFGAGLELSEYCKKVYILERAKTPIADEMLQERAQKKQNIEIILNAETKEIKGDKFVSSLIYKNREGGGEKELIVEGIFIEIGYIPATGFVKGLVDFSKRDEIKIDPVTCETKTKGLFAAGDVTDIPVKQIITSAAEGCKAALSVYEFLKKNEQD